MDLTKKRKNREIQELTATLQRLQADFENYKKRVDKEKQIASNAAIASTIKRLLPVVDAFESALKNTSDHTQFRHGIELIYTQLMSTLKDQGLRPIDALGKKLDPTKHEVLLQEVTQNGQDEQIIEELQKGYTLNDHIIRTSKVKIAKTAQSREPAGSRELENAARSSSKEEVQTDDKKGNAAEGH